MSKENIKRNQKIYEYWKETRPEKLSFAKIGKHFKHDFNGKKVPLDASAVYRIIKRMQRKEINANILAKQAEQKKKDLSEIP